MLQCHIKDGLKLNGKQTIKIPKMGEYITFRNFERKKNSPFMIYADFESVLVPEGNESKIWMNLLPTNIENMLLVIIVIN